MDNYIIVFGTDGANYSATSSVMNERFVRYMMESFKIEAEVRGVITLNDMLKALGLPLDRNGYRMGWRKGQTHNYEITEAEDVCVEGSPKIILIEMSVEDDAFEKWYDETQR